MSITPTTTPAQTTRPSRRTMLGGVAAGTGLAAAVTASAIALWPASAAEIAYDDGKSLGTAVSALYAADSEAEVDAAVADVQAAADESRSHASDELDEQITKQEDALARAWDGFVGMNTTDDGFEADLYEAELNTAVDDLQSNAAEWQDEAPDVTAAFWDGVDDGMSGE